MLRIDPSVNVNMARRSLGARRASGMTLVEMLVSISILSMIVAGMAGVSLTTIQVREEGRLRNARARDAHFAMQRILTAASRAPAILLPLAEDPATVNLESRFENGVLALTLDPSLDRDGDGYVDADNDKDGRIDEDWPSDWDNDGRVGIAFIDDDNSGITDLSFSGTADDDESGGFGQADEDPVDGIDNDGDGAIDEDAPADMNGDGAPGLAAIDDDGDGNVDEGAADDDDEDGSSDEDWIDHVVFFRSGTTLIERLPDIDPADGADYTQRIIAEEVNLFRVERLPRENRRYEVVELSLELGTGESSVSFTTRVRIGHAL